MTFHEIQRRYPRLVLMSMDAAILSQGEALSAIALYKRFGDCPDQGPQAVVHYGGPLKIIRAAIRRRHVYAPKHNALKSYYNVRA